MSLLHFMATRGGSLASSGGGGGSDIYTPRDPQAGDIFVNFAAGTDGTGTSGSPYNTLNSTRIQALSAGQQLVIRGTGAFPDVSSGGANGTSGNRIVVRAEPGYTGEFTFSGLGSRHGGGDYWDFYGLVFTCANGNGLCLGLRDDFSGSGGGQYCRIIDVTGTKTAEATSINAGSGIIYCTQEGSVGTEIIRGSYTGAGGSGNGANIWLDYAVNVKIIGVLTDNVSNPIYFKHTDVNSSGTPGGTVKNCIIRRAGRGFQAALNYVTYSNCAFDATVFGLGEAGGGLSGGNNCTITHCTFLNSDIEMDIHNTDTKFEENNVFRNNALLGTSSVYDNSSGASSNYNQNNNFNYTAVSGTGTTRYRRNGSTYTTPAAYRAAFADQEANGVAGTITLVGGSTPGSTAANWAMSAGVGLAAASDGLDCGVIASNLLTVN